MNIEQLIASMFPGWGLNRAKARSLTRLYDAAQQSSYHKSIKSGGYSGDAVMHNAGSKLRAWARYLDENHDLAIGILDTLVNNIVGTGIIVEPMVLSKRGDLHERLNNEFRALWKDFWNRPEVTRELPGPEVERLLCRSWLRDGEVLTQHLPGADRFLQHPHEVPYSIELIEADYLPFDVNSDTAVDLGNVAHGVQKNEWGQPINYLLYKEHPGSLLMPFSPSIQDLKTVPAEFITHLKLVKRIKQTRGVTILHGVIQRLADIKDYEESERIAARIAASFTAFIQRDIDFSQDLEVGAKNRTMAMNAGMIFDNLLPGESVGTIGTDRPNTNLGQFRDDQMRAGAAGTGTNYSSISKNYNGTYSAQRQEMVESRPAYQRMSNYFIAKQMMPIWKNFVDMATTAGLVRVPNNVDQASLYMPQMRGPGMPWIDPKKEVEADVLAINNHIKSRPQVIRERGGDPAMVDKEIEKDNLMVEPETSKMPTSEEDEAQEAEEEAAA